MARPPGTGNPDSKYAKNKQKIMNDLLAAKKQAKDEVMRELSENKAEMEKQLSEMRQIILDNEEKTKQIIAEKEAELKAASELRVSENETNNAERIIEKQAEVIEKQTNNPAEIIENEINNSVNNEREVIGNEEEDDTDDLINQLKRTTKQKSPDEEPPISQPKADDERFSQESKEGAAIPHIEMKDSKDGENVDAEMSPEDAADLLLNGLNALNKFVLPKLYEREYFTPRQRYQVKILLKKVEMTGKRSITFTDEDYKLLHGFNEYETYLEQIPFTEDEFKNIKTPLKKMLVGRGITISPTASLIIALALVMLPRYGVILAKKWENRSNPPQDAEAAQEPEEEGDHED